MNKGESFNEISEDLTKGGQKGDVPYGTLTSIHESPLQFGLLYVGSDDGLIHVSKDGGYQWTRITNDLPADRWVSRVQASKYDKATVYAAFNGYRNDDFKAYLYRSTNYGRTWQAIGTDLPDEPINVVKEDPTNKQVIYVGTDHGVYVSLDQGANFQAMYKDLPAVPIHDLVIHPRDREMVVATHGRSFYKATVNELQQLTDSILNADLHTFAIAKVKHSGGWGNSWSKWLAPDTPSIAMPIYVKAPMDIELEVQSKKGLKLHEQSYSLAKGINYLTYNASLVKDQAKPLAEELSELKKGVNVQIKKAKNEQYYLPKGTYKIIYRWKDQTQEQELVIE